MSLPPELGHRLATRRALGPVALVVVPAVPAVLAAGAFASLRLDDWPPYALGLFLGVFAFVLLFLGEVLAFRHHVHEHGIVTASLPLPLLRVDVIPFHTVDPGSIGLAGYERADGSFRDSRDPRRREVPGRPTMRVVGLRPDRARALARGRVTWEEAPYERIAHPMMTDHSIEQEVQPVEWVLGWPKGHEEDVAWLRGVVERSRRTRP